MIPYGRQDIDDNDVAAVLETLRSDWLTQGPAIPRFEDAVAGWCGADFAVAVSSATAALHIACLALDLGPGGRLWTSPNTFVASANCARYCGADVDFVDIDPDTLNMSVPALAAKLELAEQAGTLPDIVIPVHFGGQPCDMKAIGDLAKRYGFRVIEDASHAIGSEYQGTRTGASTYSDIAVFSFHPVKILTTGEGGMLLTNRPELHQRLIRLRSHGITRDAGLMTEAPEGGWSYQQIDLGFNYRMTDIQAALGISQMSRLESFIARRRQLAARYDQAFASWPLVLQKQPEWAKSSYHLYPIRIRPELCGKDRKTVYGALRTSGIGVNVHYIPVHTQPYYRALGFSAGDFVEAERYYSEALTLPLFPKLSDVQQDVVIAAIGSALGLESA